MIEHCGLTVAPSNFPCNYIGFWKLNRDSYRYRAQRILMTLKHGTCKHLSRTSAGCLRARFSIFKPVTVQSSNSERKTGRILEPISLEQSNHPEHLTLL